jgi:hypothetical protein
MKPKTVKNKDIMEMALGITLEFFDYPEFCEQEEFQREKDDFYAKRDLIAFGIKLMLKNSKIPCEGKGLFVEKEHGSGK